jgi:hypothetical protein
MPKTLRIAAAIAIVFAGMTGAANADLVIAKKKTVNVDCEAGVCNATAADAVLNVKDLAAMLATSDVRVFAEGPATDITLTAPLQWVSSNRLTLGAYGSLNVKAAITVAGTAGLTIATNVAGSGGTFSLVGVGQISFWDTASSLIINNTTYTLIDNLPGLIAAVAANPAGAYALSKNYDASQDGSYPHSPIPTTFTGTFEGLGNTIDKLTFYNSNDVEEDVALFSQVGTGGQICDVNLTNVSMQIYGGYLAPLAGVNAGTIVHASASGALSALVGNNWSSAGLVYDNKGTITRSHASVNMADNVEGAGGLVTINEGTISLSGASGSVTSTAVSGGLAASNPGTITDSYAQGAVTILFNEDGDAGGLVAYSVGTILRSFATGNVQGGTADPAGRFAHRPKLPGLALGGLVGASSNGSIQYAYATGSVTGYSSGGSKLGMVGGLVGGSSTNNISQTYALGALTLNGKKFLGGVLGNDNGQGSNNAAYWDLDTTGINNPTQGAGNVFDDKGLKGVSNGRLRRAILRGFDPAVWAQDPAINDGYPYLIANPPR